MRNLVREMMKSRLVPALLSIALGIVIIIARRAALDLIVKIIGGLVVTSGLAYIAVYLTGGAREPGSAGTALAPAAAAILAGILLIVFAEGVVNFFPTLMGILLILNGMSHLTAAGMDPENRAAATVMGAAVIIFGVLIVMRPGIIADAIMIFIGSFFVINGVFDLIMMKRMGSGF